MTNVVTVDFRAHSSCASVELPPAPRRDLFPYFLWGFWLPAALVLSVAALMLAGAAR